MSHVIKIVGGKDGKASPLTGQYVRVYEPTAFGGKGNLELTDSAIRAHRFDTSEDATAYVEMQNGKGERPLADFAVEIVPL